MIAHLYGVGPGDGHAARCVECRARLDAMERSRSKVEAGYGAADAIDQDRLAAQRRAMYRRIDAEQAHRSWTVPSRAWASAAIAIGLLGGGWAIREYSQPAATAAVRSQPKISDAELADQVSQIADNEPPPAAPLEALFEN